MTKPTIKELRERADESVSPLGLRHVIECDLRSRPTAWVFLYKAEEAAFT